MKKSNYVHALLWVPAVVGSFYLETFWYAKIRYIREVSFFDYRLTIIAVSMLIFTISMLLIYKIQERKSKKMKNISKIQITPMNAVVLNGKVTELTEDQIKSIIDGLGGKVKRGDRKLSSIKAGETFKIGDREFIVLEQSGDTTAVLSKKLIENEAQFGDTPDFDKSNVKKILAKFGAEIATEIGIDAIIEHKVDQTSLDGMKHYGATKARMSLMTIDHVRKYADVLDKHKVDKWYWLVTPWSIPERGHERLMCVVAPSGCVIYIDSDYGYIGVRPFCIFSSSIFVSREA